MPKVFAVYIPSSARPNLEAGLNQLVWGWRDSVLDHKNFRAIAQGIEPGDLLVVGVGGPNPRVEPGAWAGATLRRSLILRASSALYHVDARYGPTTRWGRSIQTGWTFRFSMTFAPRKQSGSKAKSSKRFGYRPTRRGVPFQWQSITPHVSTLRPMPMPATAMAVPAGVTRTAMELSTTLARSTCLRRFSGDGSSANCARRSSATQPHSAARYADELSLHDSFGRRTSRDALNARQTNCWT